MERNPHPVTVAAILKPYPHQTSRETPMVKPLGPTVCNDACFFPIRMKVVSPVALEIALFPLGAPHYMTVVVTKHIRLDAHFTK